MSLREVARLEAGDFIPLEIPVRVRAEVEGVPLFDCRYGARNGHYALRIENVLRPENHDFTQE